MIEFWVSIGIITFFVCISIIFPLLKREEPKSIRFDANHDIIEYESQLNEASQSYNAGLLTRKQATELQIELKRRIILADKRKKELPLTQSLSGRAYFFLALSSALFFSIGSVMLYLQIGQPGLPNLSYSDRNLSYQKAAHSNDKTRTKIQKKIANLLDRLEMSPEDKSSWINLGRILIEIGKYNKAEEAFYMAYKLDSKSAAIGADYAESRILNNNGNVNKETFNILNMGYQKTPSNPKILFYLGQGKAQAKDFKGALENWTDLLFLSDDNAPWIPAVKKQIAIALKQSGLDPLSIKPSQIAKTIAKMRKVESIKTLDPSTIDAASKMNFEERSNMIRNMVKQLENRLKKEPNDARGWARLAKAFTVLGNELKAKKAMQKFNELSQKEEREELN